MNKFIDKVYSQMKFMFIPIMIISYFLNKYYLQLTKENIDINMAYFILIFISVLMIVYIIVLSFVCLINIRYIEDSFSKSKIKKISILSILAIIILVVWIIFEVLIQ